MAKIYPPGPYRPFRLKQRTDPISRHEAVGIRWEDNQDRTQPRLPHRDLFRWRDATKQRFMGRRVPVMPGVSGKRMEPPTSRGTPRAPPRQGQRQPSIRPWQSQKTSRPVDKFQTGSRKKSTSGIAHAHPWTRTRKIKKRSHLVRLSAGLSLCTAWPTIAPTLSTLDKVRDVCVHYRLCPDAS